VAKDGRCVRLRPERANHEWSYDFVNARTHGGSDLGILANKSDEPELPQLVTL